MCLSVLSFRCRVQLTWNELGKKCFAAPLIADSASDPIRISLVLLFLNIVNMWPKNWQKVFPSECACTKTGPMKRTLCFISILSSAVLVYTVGVTNKSARLYVLSYDQTLPFCHQHKTVLCSAIVYCCIGWNLVFCCCHKPHFWRMNFLLAPYLIWSECCQPDF